MSDEAESTYDRPDGREYRCEESGHYSVLDRGYLKVIESWGSDERVIESARMSTDKGFLGWDPGPCPTCEGNGTIPTNPHARPNTAQYVKDCTDCNGKGTHPGDAKLLKYLHEKKHSSPFEFAGLTIEVQAPIMVFREWHRHRVPFGYSEMSARYVQMPNLHYVPSAERIIASARKSKNKQASGGGELRVPAEDIRRGIREEQQRVYANYEQLLSFGVAKEVARLDTPVSRYSRMRATGNLRGWLGFMTLRLPPDAQFEIRQFAWCVAEVIEQTFPRSYALFNKSVQPLLDPESVDTPEKAWYRGAALVRAAFHQHAKLGDNDPLWELSIPDYIPPVAAE